MKKHPFLPTVKPFHPFLTFSDSDSLCSQGSLELITSLPASALEVMGSQNGPLCLLNKTSYHCFTYTYIILG